MTNENPTLENNNEDGVTRREFLGVDSLLPEEVTTEDVLSGPDTPTTRREFLGGSLKSKGTISLPQKNPDGTQIPTTRRGFFRTILGKQD